MAIYDIHGNELHCIEPSVYKGKKISFLGDSITTYVGYIPSGQSSEYNGSNYGVTSVNDTWWMKVINALEMTLELNNSWAGSHVATYDTNPDKSGVNRATNLGTAPDVIIVYMGINDFQHEVALGDYAGLTPVPSDTTIFRSAYSITLDRIMTKYKSAEIWCATLPQCERNGTTGAPEINDAGVPLSHFNNAIRELCQIFGAKVLEFAQSGLTYQNKELYVATDAVHPTNIGMSLLANQAISQLDPYCRTRYALS